MAPKKLTADEVFQMMKASGLKTASDSVQIIRELRDGRNNG
ncbi:MAG: hypothetical protein V1724_08395 [Chloroflexota bacterium]